MLHEKQDNNCKIFHYTSTKTDLMANSAFLMSAFMVIILQRTPDEAWKLFI